MAKQQYDTPMLDQLETGPWPSFVTGLKRLANDNDMMVDLLGQLETSYQTKIGYWKGGTVGVIGYGGGVIPRFTELKGDDGKPVYPAAAEFHTIRIMPPPGMHYDTQTLRDMCDIWEEYGSGLIAFHGQSGDIMFQGCSTDNVQPAFDAINKLGFDMGGAGPAVRTGMSCVGAARCENSCLDEGKTMRMLVNNGLDDMHRPALPYKFKYKVSGCPNDCVNSVQRADLAVIGTWRDDIKIDAAEVKNFIADRGRKYVIDNVVTRCPTQAITLNDDDSIAIDNSNCVRCMHCINVMNVALSPGDDKGVTLLCGGKRTLKIGDLMGTVIVPFHKMETDDDFEWLEDLATEILDFFAENALEHERTGEMIERVGLTNFLEGVELEVDPHMISSPRSNPYFRSDDWDEEAAKWNERKAG